MKNQFYPLFPNRHSCLGIPDDISILLKDIRKQWPGFKSKGSGFIILFLFGFYSANGENTGSHSVGEREISSCGFSAPTPASRQFDGTMQWVLLPAGEDNGSCESQSDCCENIVCYGLQYTPVVDATVTDYTTGFFVNCNTANTPITLFDNGIDPPYYLNTSCVLMDNSITNPTCIDDVVLFNSSGLDISFELTNGVPVILHQVCFTILPGESLTISEDEFTDLVVSLEVESGMDIIYTDAYPTYTPFTITRPLLELPADAFDVVDCINKADPELPGADPALPEIYDLCGVLIPGILISTVEIPDPVTCEGTRILTYEFSDCVGQSDTWTITYTIDVPVPPLPPNDSLTVECPLATNTVPTPPLVPDPCGGFYTPVGAVTPEITCEGNRIYSWTYTNCANESSIWTYKYKVDRTIIPVEIGGPVSMSSPLDCYLDVFEPMDLPVIQDACGTILDAPEPVVGGSNSGNCGGTITYTYTYSDCAGLQKIWVYTYSIACEPLLLKVMLEGPYDSTTHLMNTALNYNHVMPGQNPMLSPNFPVQSQPPVPFGQPYNVLPWNYSGNAGNIYGDASSPGAPMNVTPYPLDVVDWVLVTIRKNGLLPAHNIWTCAGWVHADGTVTFPDDCPLPAFNDTEAYRFLIQHRNHLGVLSQVPVSFPCGTAQLEFDFTAADSYAPVFRFGQKQIEKDPSVWGMYAANGDQTLPPINGINAINSADLNVYKLQQNGIGYKRGDYDMTAVVTANDETVWKRNQNKTSGIIFY